MAQEALFVSSPTHSMPQKSIMKCFAAVEELGIVFENYQKSLKIFSQFTKISIYKKS